MRTIRTKVYKFNELSESAQKKALTEMWDINVDYDWWSSVYEDAAEVGIKINEFDIDRPNYCRGELTLPLTESCNKIIKTHGEECDTYLTAKLYLAEWAKLVCEHSDGINTDKVAENKESDFDELADELEKQYRLSICNDYLTTLRKEYEYLTSDEAIKETITANEYEFTVNGKKYS